MVLGGRAERAPFFCVLPKGLKRTETKIAGMDMKGWVHVYYGPSTGVCEKQIGKVHHAPKYK